MIVQLITDFSPIKEMASNALNTILKLLNLIAILKF